MFPPWPADIPDAFRHNAVGRFGANVGVFRSLEQETLYSRLKWSIRMLRCAARGPDHWPDRLR
jgi:hypothetical protein